MRSLAGMESNLYAEDEDIINTDMGEDMNKEKKQKDSKNDCGHTEEKENEVNEEKENNSPEKNKNKKRDRDEEEGNSPTRKRVRNSPTKRRGRKSKIEKGKNFNQKYKKARKCKDCEGEDEEKCVLCGKDSRKSICTWC